MIDGGLRPLFRKHVPGFWTSIESGSTGAGIPDAHVIFPNSVCCWVEFKLIKANAVTLRPHQTAWILRYCRSGGRAFIIVRQKETLYIFDGCTAAELARAGLKGAAPLLVTTGGPSRWDWVTATTILSGAAQTSGNSPT